MLGRQKQGIEQANQIDIIARPRNDLLIDKEISGSWDPSEIEFYPSAMDSSSRKCFIQVGESIVSSLDNDCKFQIELSSKIEVLHLLESSNILLIGERRGVLHFINAISGDMLHSQQISEPSSPEDLDMILPTFSGIAVGTRDDGKEWDLMIVMGSGLIVRLSFPIVELDDCSSSFEELKAGIYMEMIESGFENVLAVSVFSTNTDSLQYQHNLFYNLKSLYQDDSVFVLAHMDAGLLLWTRSEDGQTRQVRQLSSKLFHDSVQSIVIDQLSGLVILLGTESWVYLVDLYTFTMVGRKQVSFRSLKSLNLVHTESFTTDADNTACSKLMGLFDNGSTKSVQMFNAKSLLPLSNSLEFPGGNIYFPNTPFNHQSTFLAVTKEGEAGFYTCEQSDSSSVLARLINEGKHEDAVAFIQSKDATGLNMENYYKLCLELKSHAVSIEDTLSHISDARFLKSFASNYEMVSESESSPELPSTMRIISLVQGALVALGGKETAAMTKQLKAIAHRFVTFSMIDKTKRTFWGNDWHIFRTSNMRVSLQHALASKDIATSLLLIKRHFKDDMMIECLDSIMREFPKSLNLALSVLLLDQLRSECLAEYEAREIIDQWLLDAIEIIEKNERNLKKCLDLLKWASSTPKELLSKSPSAVLSPSSYISHLLTLSQEKEYQQSPVQKGIQKRIVQIEHIIELDEAHGFKITLADFESTPLGNVAMSLLDRVAVSELLGSCIDLHLTPFTLKHGLDLDQILVDYCKEVMDSGQLTTFSAWEARVLKLIPLIKSKNYRISTLLDLMRRSPVPWSDDLDRQICKTIESMFEVASIDHRKSSQNQELLEHYKLMRLKRMLSDRYNVKKFNVADITLAKRIVPFILKNVDIVDAVNDAILAMEVYNQTSLSQIIFLRACHLVEHGLNERLDNLLRHGSENSAVSCAASIFLNEDESANVLKELTIWISERLNRMQSRKSTLLVHFLSILKSGILVSGISCDPIKLRLFESCLELTSSLSLCFAPSMMDSDDLKLKILVSVLHTDSIGQIAKFRIGELLGYSQQFVIYRSACVHAESLEWDSVFKLCKDMENKFPGSETADLVFKLAQSLLATLEESEPTLLVYNILMDICQIALKNSGRLNVVKILSFTKKVEIFKRVLSKTDLGAYQSSLNEDDCVFQKAGPSVQNYENGLVMSSDSILPLLLNYLVGQKTEQLENNSSLYYDQTLEAAQKCARDRNYHNALRLVQLLAEEYGMTAVIQSIINDCLVNIFQNSLNVHEDLYCKLGLGCLLLVSSNSSSELVKSNLASSAKDYKRLHRVAKIGSLAALFWQNNSLQSTCLDLVEYAKWMDEFDSLGIPFQYSTLRPENKTPGGSSQQKMLVEELFMKKGQSNICTVLEYAKLYMIEDDYVYFQAIKLLCLANSDLSSHQSTTKLIQTIALVSDCNQLMGKMNEYMGLMSPYDYEGIATVLNEISKISKDEGASHKKSILILGILGDYVRSESPSSHELKNAEKHSEAAWKYHLSKSNKRLPFHSLIKDPLSVLTPEISESTLPRLMPLAPLLNLDGDKYHEAIIHKKVDILQKIRSGAIDSFNSIVFADFKLIILKIKDFASAIKITVYVAGAFPRGQDRIAGYRLAMSISERWISALQKSKNEKLAEKANTGYQKIKLMLGIAQTEFALQSNGLSSLDEYVVNPNALLTKLLTFDDSLGVSASVIHEIATGVATRDNIDLDKFKLILLQKWLTKNDDSSTSTIDERVLFLLHGKYEWGMKHLLTFSNLPAAKISSAARIKALSCLVRLSTNPECCEMDFSKIQNRLQTVLYLAEFDSIGITQSATQFETCDKHALARSLWVSHRSSVEGLRLICRLCLDFNIPDSVLGSNVFKALLHESDLDFLLQVLDKISCTPLFASLSQVWVEALKQSIAKWISADQYNLDFFNYLDILVKFPSLATVDDLVETFSAYLTSQKSNMSINSFEKSMAICYGLFVLNEHSKVCEWVGAQDKNGILNILDTLTPETTTMHSFLVDSVFDFVDREQLYPYVLISSHWSQFVTFLIEHDRIDRILLASITEGRKEEALKLFRVYAQAYSPGFEEDELVSLLEGYIEERGVDLNIDIATHFADVI